MNIINNDLIQIKYTTVNIWGVIELILWKHDLAAQIIFIISILLYHYISDMLSSGWESWIVMSNRMVK